MEIHDKKIEGEFVGFTPFELSDEEHAWIVGTFQHKENQICIAHANCKGKLKPFMNYLVDKFKTSKILIYNVLTENWKGLKDFEPFFMEDPTFHEQVFCLKGEWKAAEAAK